MSAIVVATEEDAGNFSVRKFIKVAVAGRELKIA
jgi:hypothetical protein